MLVVAIVWELYARTGSALPLAFVGLSQMVPMILCTIPAGHFADKFNRKKIILIPPRSSSRRQRLGLTLSSVFALNLIWIYFFLAVIGAARTFLWPASAAFVTSLVPREQFARAVTFNSGLFQFSSVIGPVAFGLALAFTPHAAQNHTAWSVYALNVAASLACFALVMPIKHVHKVKPAEPVSVKSLVEGFNFVYQNKIILGVITLDLFAVLLGGARYDVAADFCEGYFSRHADGFKLAARRDDRGRGDLRAGRVCASSAVEKSRPDDALVRRDFRRGDDSFWHRKRELFRQPVFQFVLVLVCVHYARAGGRGGSNQCRRATNACANPDARRKTRSCLGGQQPSLSASNELGGFRSGIVAWLFASPTVLGNAAATGAIVSTVTGGIGTILVVLAVAWIWPEIRKYGQLA